MSNEPINYKEDDVNKRIQEVLDLLTKASPVLFSEEYMCKAGEISGKRKEKPSASETKHQEMSMLRKAYLEAREEGTLISKTIKSTNGISCPECSSQQLQWINQDKNQIKCRKCGFDFLAWVYD